MISMGPLNPRLLRGGQQDALSKPAIAALVPETVRSKVQEASDDCACGAHRGFLRLR